MYVLFEAVVSVSNNDCMLSISCIHHIQPRLFFLVVFSDVYSSIIPTGSPSLGFLFVWLYIHHNVFIYSEVSVRALIVTSNIYGTLKNQAKRLRTVVLNSIKL